MTEESNTPPICYKYVLKFDDGAEKEFEILLDGESLELLGDCVGAKPEWTRLTYSQCENCPLPNTVHYCPIAVNLSRLVSSFSDSVSYRAAVVTVETPQRTYQRKTTLQKALSAIIGLYMPTSNCPIMDKLRPMTRFHLPFANSLETYFRSVSSYLVAQLMLKMKGKEPDWELRGLREIYKAVNTVNKGISCRLVNATKMDANVNAVVILHSFGDGISYFIDSGLEEIESMFRVFLDEPKEYGIQEAKNQH